MGPDPAVAAVRLGVRRALTGLDSGALALAACSGGPDSLAMSAALAFEAPRLGLRAGAVTVDHGLQPGSAGLAERVAGTLRGLGLNPVHSLRAEVAVRGDAGGFPGPEAAARQARYAVIEAAAVECGAAAVLLGHTMDDQAETVLLGLARGSGARSLAGMRGSAGRVRRLLPACGARQTRAACAALGLEPWMTRRTPTSPSPGPGSAAGAAADGRPAGLGIAEALARTADRPDDADALDAVTDEVAGAAAAGVAAAGAAGAGRGEGDLTLDVAALAALPAAIRTRLLRRAAIAAGAPAGSLSAAHVHSIDALVTAWHGQRWSDLPGGIRCQRRYGRLHFTTRQ
jgi:tRNA(Ile)-lysidine synthase